MKKLDLSSFKKMGSDGHATHFVNDDGHKISIAHKSLTPKMRGQLYSIKADKAYAKGGKVKPYADGGEMDDASAEPTKEQMAAEDAKYMQNYGNMKRDETPVAADVQDTSTGVAPSQNQQAMNIGQDASSLPSIGQLPPPAVNDMPQGPAIPAQGANQNDPMGYQQYLNSMRGAMNQSASAERSGAKAVGQAGNREAQALDENIRTNKVLNDYTQHMEAFHNDAINKAMKVYSDTNVDPNRLQNSWSSGHKVSNAIGIILGGIGGGLLHQENPALKIINQQINRDIESQKIDLGKKDNLLNANFKQLGNMHDAVNMTRVMNAAITADKISKAAALAKDPMAAANAQKAIAQLTMQYAPIKQQIDQRQGMMRALQGTQDPAIKARLMGMNGLIPEGQVPEIQKQITEQNMKQNQVKDILGLWKTAQGENTAMGRAGRMGYNPPSINAMRSGLEEVVKDTAGRPDERKIDELMALAPHPFDKLGTQQENLENFKRQLNLHVYNANLHSLGLGPNPQQKIGESQVQTGPMKAPKK